MTTTDITRRELIATLARSVLGAAALGVLSNLRPADLGAATTSRKIVVYKDPDCGCCREWVKHLGKNGFTPEAHDRNDMDALKDSLGVPRALRSCHTAVVGHYLIEGHVPANDIARLLARAPKGVAGLAVPGMPVGSPGMEMTGRRRDRFDVIAFSTAGATSVFASHA